MSQSRPTRPGGAEAWRAQNQFRVFNFIQTPLVNGRTLLAIEPLSQGDRAFNSTWPPEPIRVSVTLAPKHVGRKETPCKYLQSCKENRLLVCCREPSSDLLQPRSSASPGAGGRWDKLPRIWPTKVLLAPSLPHLLPSASINSKTLWMRKRI